MMNHIGVCLSYDATWQCLRRLTSEARFLEIIKHDHWIWIYDNLNFKMSIRHERSGMQVHTCTYISLLKHTFIYICTLYCNNNRHTPRHDECHFQTSSESKKLT